jgi:hypothetical protein
VNLTAFLKERGFPENETHNTEDYSAFTGEHYVRGVVLSKYSFAYPL